MRRLVWFYWLQNTIDANVCADADQPQATQAHASRKRGIYLSKEP